jgi:hypothetical protein
MNFRNYVTTLDSVNPNFGVRHRVHGLTPGFKRPEIWAQNDAVPVVS